MAESFLKSRPSTLILGDNIFYRHNIGSLLSSASKRAKGATIFGYHVKSPHAYGIVEFDSNKKVLNIEEKPENPKSSFAITGLYFYDDKAVEYAKALSPSKRGELEITDLNQIYLEEDSLYLELMGRGYAWLDTGTHESLLEANQFVQTIEHRQGLKIACLEEIAFRKGWIGSISIEQSAYEMSGSDYGKYLKSLIKRRFV